MTLSLNHELVSRVNLCLLCVFPDTVKDCPKMRNLPEIFLRTFESVGTCSQCATYKLTDLFTYLQNNMLCCKPSQTTGQIKVETVIELVKTVQPIRDSIQIVMFNLL